MPIVPGVFGFLGLASSRADMASVRRFLENKTLALAGVFLVDDGTTTVCRDFEGGIRERSADLVFADDDSPGRRSSRKPTPASCPSSSMLRKCRGRSPTSPDAGGDEPWPPKRKTG